MSNNIVPLITEETTYEDTIVDVLNHLKCVLLTLKPGQSITVTIAKPFDTEPEIPSVKH